MLDRNRHTAITHAALAGLSGLLGAACFPSISWHAAAWFAYVPLLVALRGASVLRAFLLGGLTGFVGLPIAFWWVCPGIQLYLEVSTLISLISFVLFTVWHSGQLALFAAFVVGLRATNSPLLAAAAWVICEALMPRLFPWQLGQALEPHLPFIQATELGGPLLLSAAVITVNGFVARSFDDTQTSTQRIRSLATVVAVLAVLEVYGRTRIAAEQSANQAAERIAVAVVQGNLPATRDNSVQFVDQALLTYSELVRRVAPRKPNLIVWPEAALRTDILQDRNTLDAVTALAAETGSLQMVGAGSRLDDGREGSGAFLVSISGDIIGAYHKTKLFPFSETVPSGLSFVRRWLPADDLAPGSTRGPLLIPGTRLAPSICYEAMFGGFFRDAVRGGATFAVNMTNDVWFGDTGGPRQHLQSAVLRAVESRRWLVRAANSGISAIIDSTGQIIARTEMHQPATLSASISRRNEITPYMRYGDWVLYLSIALIIARFTVRRRM